MGFTPREVDDMSMWEINVAAEGFARSNGGGGGKAPSDADFEAALAADTATDG